MNDELFHYGVKGQKWGVRRYQYEDGSLTPDGREHYGVGDPRGKVRRGAQMKSDLVWNKYKKDISPKQFIRKQESDEKTGLELKKGEKVHHVTPLEFTKLRDGQDLYVSATDVDRDTYRAYLSMMLESKGYGMKTPISEVEFTLKRDLKAPGVKDQRKMFNDVYRQNKELFNQELDKYYANKTHRPKSNYDAFIKSLDSKGESKKIFYDYLKKNGYNAVLDDHDITESWMNAYKPLIIMDCMNTIGDLKVSQIKDSDIEESLRRLGVKI